MRYLPIIYVLFLSIQLASPPDIAPPIPVVTTPVSHVIYDVTIVELNMLAQTVWGEARGCSAKEQAYVVWTILQRVDHPSFPNSISAVILQPRQFRGYHPSFPVEESIFELALDEVRKWQSGLEPPTCPIFAPDLPYLFFHGDGVSNYFRASFKSRRRPPEKTNSRSSVC